MKKMMLIMLMISLPILGQARVDSLEALVMAAAEDTAKVNLLNELSEAMQKKDLGLVLKYAQQALELAEKLNHKKGEATALNNIAFGNIFLGNNEVALEYAIKSLQVSEEYNLKLIMATALRVQGLVYLNLKQHEKALEFFEQNIALLEEAGDTSQTAINLNNIAVVYDEIGNYEKALQYAQKSMKLKQAIGDELGIAYSLGIMAVAHRKSGDYQMALDNLKRALKIIESKNDKLGRIYAIKGIGNTYREMGEYGRAISYLKRSLKAAQQLKAKKELQEIYESLSITYEKMGEYDRSLENYKFFKIYNDSTFNEKTAKQISEIQTSYETEKIKSEITLLRKDKEIRDLADSQQELYRNILTLGLIVFVVIIGLIANFYRVKRKGMIKEHLQNIELQKMNQDLQKEIVERRQIDEEWKKSQRMLQLVMDNIPQAIFWKNLQSEYIGCNNNFAKEAGFDSPDDVIGKTDYDLDWRKSEADYFHNTDRTVMDKDEPEFHKVRQTSTNGKKSWQETNRVPLHDLDGKVVGILGTFEDITDRVKFEKALAAEKENLSVTLRSIGDGVITTDTSGRIQLFNEVAEEIVGVMQEDVENKPLSEVVTLLEPKSREPIESPIKRVLNSGTVTELSDSVILISLDKTKYTVDLNAAPIKDADNNVVGVVLAFRDITARQKMEEELRKTQKLESLGILAGGIAHDFNNILTGILANISFAKVYADKNEESMKRLHEAERACFRAEGLTQQLLTFAKGGLPIKQAVSIDKLIESAVSFALRGSNVSHKIDIPEDLWTAEVDEGQINQVFNNLVINADQAMPEGGVLKVTAKNVIVHQEHNIPVKPGRYVKIVFQDQGIGMSKDHQKKIFDPYFTTKQKGSGLGLATSYSIIKNHDGLIDVKSKPNRGSTFFVYLPASKVELAEEEKQIAMSFNGRGRILLLDDEDIIVEIVERMLEHIGYTVNGVGDGQEALTLYKEAGENGEPYDMVILDLTIPGGMGGRETLEKLREIDPDVKAIVSSGYSNDPIMSNFQDYGFKNVITKPFNLEQLSKVLHEVMNGNGVPGK